MNPGEVESTPKIDYSYEVKLRRQELIDAMKPFMDENPDILAKFMAYLESYEKFQDGYIDCAKRNMELEDISRARTQAVMEVSHELKAPITSVLSMLNIIKEGYVTDEDKKQELIERSQTRLSEMVRLIKDLLNLSRAELHPETIQMQAINLVEMANRLVEDYTPDMLSNEVVPCIKIQPDLPKVLGNEIMIKRVLENLISNGIKYNNPGGKLCLDILEVGDGFVNICVKDDGKGMTDDELSSLFSLFYRGKNQIKLKKEGTGLGLSFTKRIIDAHNGELKVDSKIGVGTSFCFKLKIVD